MGLIDEGKSILSLVNKAANRELYERLMSYLDKVFELQAQRMKFQEDLEKAGATIRSLEEKLAFKARLQRHHEAYKVEGEERVICMTCWEKNKEAITLIEVTDAWMCPVCKNTFSDGQERGPYSIQDEQE